MPGMPPDEHMLALRQVDQARTDFANIEDALEFLMQRVSYLPTRMELARMALGIIVGTAGITTLLGWWLLAH
jgi:hypothetical protein